MSDSSASDDPTRTMPSTAGERWERDVIFYPGYDKRDPNPSKNYGICGGRLIFVLKGTKGAIQFMVGMPLYPDTAVQHLINHHNGNAYEIAKSMKPSGWDVGYHSHEPMYEGHEPMQGECHIIGGKCFYDGSSLRADEWLSEFLVGGTNWLWPQMEREYRDRFSPAVNPQD